MLPPKGCEQVGVQRDAPTYDRGGRVVHCGTRQAWHIGAVDRGRGARGTGPRGRVGPA